MRMTTRLLVSIFLSQRGSLKMLGRVTQQRITRRYCLGNIHLQLTRRPITVVSTFFWSWPTFRFDNVVLSNSKLLVQIKIRHEFCTSTVLVARYHSSEYRQQSGTTLNCNDRFSYRRDHNSLGLLYTLQ